MNVGDYVRTKDGKIFKWTKYCTTSKEDYNEHTRKLLLDENEIKSSPQIIDLIEKNDLITLTSEYCKDEVYRVVGILKGVIELDLFEDGTMQIGNDDIKTIVTHEQMETMQYRVEE